MPRPLLTVVLPVRNGAEHLGEALASIRAQDYEPLQVVVVDGHSHDRSAAIAGSFGADVVAQRGRGLANAWNEALSHARGELVAFIGHDDRWLPNKLVMQVDHLSSHPELLMSHTWFRFVLLEGHQPPPGFRRGLLQQVQTGRLMETLVARKHVFDAVGPFDEQYAVSPDMDWFARATDAGVRADMVPEILLLKGVHRDNTVNQVSINDANLRTLLRASVARKRQRGASEA